MQLFLGVDGGQTSTQAVIADEQGQVLGRGQGGAANHADEPGGKARLESAIRLAAGSALQQAGLGELRSVRFQSAYFALTGGARAKETVIRRWIRTRQLKVEQDTRAAWAGALGCRPLFSPEMGALFLAYDAFDAKLSAEIVRRLRVGK